MRLLRDFAEIPGAIILLLVSWFQISLSSKAQNEVLKGYIFALERQVLDLCARVHKAEIGLKLEHSYCEEIPYNPTSEEGDGHLTWPEAAQIFSSIETFAFLIGLFLFIVGITYRLNTR